MNIDIYFNSLAYYVMACIHTHALTIQCRGHIRTHKQNITQEILKSSDDIKLSIHLMIIKYYFCVDAKKEADRKYGSKLYYILLLFSSRAPMMMIRIKDCVRPETFFSKRSLTSNNVCVCVCVLVRVYAILLFVNCYKGSFRYDEYG